MVVKLKADLQETNRKLTQLDKVCDIVLYGYLEVLKGLTLNHNVERVNIKS